MNRGRQASTGDLHSGNWRRRRSLTPTRPVLDLVQTFDEKSGRITRSSSSSSSSSEDEQKKMQVIIVEKRERPRKSSLVKPDRPRQKKQSNVSFAMQVGKSFILITKIHHLIKFNPIRKGPSKNKI